MQNQAISGNNPEGIFLISFVPAMHHPVPIKKREMHFQKFFRLGQNALFYCYSGNFINPTEVSDSRWKFLAS
jgi:hypothetical protein